MNRQKGFTLPELLIVLICVVGAIGWVMNAVKIITAISDPLTRMFILRCVGLFLAPLGAILGFIPS